VNIAIMNSMQFPAYDALRGTAFATTLTPDTFSVVAAHTMTPLEHLAHICSTIRALDDGSTAITRMDDVDFMQSSVHLYATESKKNTPLTTKRVREDDTTTDNKCAKTANNKHEKIIPCTVCGQMFSQKPNMQEHVKSFHNKEKHQCAICKKDLSSRSNLSAHMKKTHSAKDKRCEVCKIDMRGDLPRHSLTKKHIAAVAKAQSTTTEKFTDDANDDGVETDVE
jgi:Zinc finger, C2H2 type